RSPYRCRTCPLAARSPTTSWAASSSSSAPSLPRSSSTTSPTRPSMRASSSTRAASISRSTPAPAMPSPSPSAPKCRSSSRKLSSIRLAWFLKVRKQREKPASPRKRAYPSTKRSSPSSSSSSRPSTSTTWARAAGAIRTPKSPRSNDTCGAALAGDTPGVAESEGAMDYAESLVRHLTNTVRCSSCGANFQADDVNVLGHQGELWFLTVTCARCHTQGLIAALVRGNPESLATPPAELTAADDGRAHTGEPVTDAEVADMRNFLRHFHGDLHTLLRAS